MNCNNCKNCSNLIIPTSITTSGGITTITIPTGTTFRSGVCYCLGLCQNIPAGTNGTQINVTNGTTTWSVFNRLANYWRPCCSLVQGSTLKLKYLNDPVHFLKV